MSKNLTRKGLALGAIVALGASVFAGSPAFAANELNVAPSAGTSYTAVAGSVFNLATTFAPGYTPASFAQLKYIVKTDANSAVSYDAFDSTAATSAVVTAPATTQAVSLSSSAVSAKVDSALDIAYLGLQTAADVNSSVEVTAFVDANNDGAVTAGEWNTVKTVTFKKLADITPVVTLSKPSTGDTTLKATVVWGDVNVEQISNETVKFTASVQGSTPLTASAGTLADGVWSKTVTALVSAEAVTAQAYVGTTALGTAASAAATARTVSSITANVVKGNDAIATSATTGAASTAATVRTNGTFVASVKALDTATTAVAAPSVAVTATFSTNATLVPASTGVTEKSVTVNGTKYTTAASLAAASVALTTDATGVASVTVSSSGLANPNTITVSFAAQNFTSAVVATQTDAAYTVSDDNASTVVATNKNTATTLAYSVKDQFGVLSARTNERLVVTATTAATVTQYVPVVAGKASFVVTPVTDSTASIAVSSVLQISTTVDATGTTWATNGTNAVTNTINIRSAAYSFTVAPEINASTGINNGAWTAAGAQKQSLITFDATDSAATGYVAPAASTSWAKVSLTGSNAGEKLTVSGTDVFLSIDGSTVAKNTASKVAQAANVDIFVASNTTGAKTLTITNGTVSATVVVTFDKSVAVASLVAAAGAKVALGTLPASSQFGRSIDVSAVITDKFGNPLADAKVVLSSTGVGYLANTTSTSDASGKVTAKLIVGAGEDGDAVITASATLGDATVAAASKTVTFGATDAQVDIVANRVTAVASYSKGKTVAFYVDGIKKWSKVSTSDADVVLNYNLKKGTHTVTVKISGGFVTTEKFIVK